MATRAISKIFRVRVDSGVNLMFHLRQLDLLFRQYDIGTLNDLNMLKIILILPRTQEQRKAELYYELWTNMHYRCRIKM